MDACDLEPKSVRFKNGYWDMSDLVIVPQRFHSQLEVFCLYSPRWVMGMTWYDGMTPSKFCSDSAFVSDVGVELKNKLKDMSQIPLVPLGCS